MKGLLKKNQIIIYVIAIMLMTAGYLNYTTKHLNLSYLLQKVLDDVALEVDYSFLTF